MAHDGSIYTSKQVTPVYQYADLYPLSETFFTQQAFVTLTLLHGVSDYNINRLQLKRNDAASIVTTTRKHGHIVPIIQNVRMLPVRHRIHFKV